MSVQLESEIATAKLGDPPSRFRGALIHPVMRRSRPDRWSDHAELIRLPGGATSDSRVQSGTSSIQLRMSSAVSVSARAG